MHLMLLTGRKIWRNLLQLNHTLFDGTVYWKFPDYIYKLLYIWALCSPGARPCTYKSLPHTQKKDKQIHRCIYKPPVEAKAPGTRKGEAFWNRIYPFYNGIPNDIFNDKWTEISVCALKARTFCLAVPLLEWRGRQRPTLISVAAVFGARMSASHSKLNFHLSVIIYGRNPGLPRRPGAASVQNNTGSSNRPICALTCKVCRNTVALYKLIIHSAKVLWFICLVK